MKMPWRSIVVVAVLVTSCAGFAAADSPGPPPIAAIERRVPPAGIELTAAQRASLEEGLAALAARLEKVRGNALYPDAAVYHKAVDYALHHGEFYKVKKDYETAEQALADGLKRANQLEEGTSPWEVRRGPSVRGYVSSIDGSVQPYGLEIPEGLALDKAAPLYVWLHGRGDTNTDLYFIAERSSKAGKFVFGDGIVLHPFGRQCIGWKSAGEIDVMEAIADVSKRYAIDADRIALMGFSMGGAGAWHLGAHYAERWAVVHAGAGFAETALYNALAKEDYPVWYEETLWGLYDVPNYARNLLNLPVIAYSGEEDKQIQAARVMEAAFLDHGSVLLHVIGPGMGHKYHPDSQAEVAAFVAEAIGKGRNRHPGKVHLQTRTLRYPQMHWVRIEGLEEHWKDSRVDAELESGTNLVVSTKNVTRLRLGSPWQGGREFPEGFGIEIDGWKLRVDEAAQVLRLDRSNGGDWALLSPGDRAESAGMRKMPGLQGPIDDVFMEPFLVVLPGGKSKNPRVQRWVEFELAHFQKRWRELFRGELRTRLDSEVTAEDRERYHLVLWGTPESNSEMKAFFENSSPRDISWSAESIALGNTKFAPENHVLAMIRPSEPTPSKYVAINGAPTFREAHDRTNSLQNPKLPDWAVINLDAPPDAEAPGEVVAADFFDEEWRLKVDGR